jgi:hypothetical protein
MDFAQITSITDVTILRKIVVDQLSQIAAHDAKVAAYEAQATAQQRCIVYKSAKIAALTAEIMRLRRVQFAARSEKMDPERQALFDETMAADIAAVETELEALQSPEVAAQAKVSHGTPKRQPLPASLPRVETRHEPDSCTCGQCGADLVQIGEHVSEAAPAHPAHAAFAHPCAASSM